MQEPLMGEPHRPTEVQLRPGPDSERLKPQLEELGIHCVLVEELDQLDFVFTNLGESVAGEQPPSLLEMPGVTPEAVASFFEAAASFYEKAPWRLLGYEETLKIECDKYESGPWYGVIMGQGGLTYGLALYDDLSILTRMRHGDLSDEENARLTVALTLTYVDEEDFPPGDLEAVRRFGWKVARPEAYPSLFRKERGLVMRPPLAWELELMEGCLRAIPDFVARHKPDDLTRDEVIVPVAAGELRLALGWVSE
jgi:hypothetical protein